MIPALLFFMSVLSVGFCLNSYFKLGHGLRSIALAYGMGTALIALELFLYFVVLRLSFSPIIFWLLGLQTILTMFITFKKIGWKRNFIFVWEKKYWLAAIFATIVVLFLAANFILAISKPLVAYDGITHWSLRAKMLLIDKEVNFNASSENYLELVYHRNYPWHFSLLEYWLRLLGGNGGWLSLVSWGYFVSLTFLIIDAVRRWLGNWQGFLAGLLFVSMPLIFYHAYNNYADLPLAYYSAIGFLFFIEWLLNNQQKLLISAAVFSGWGIFVKNDGIFYALAFIITLLLMKFFAPAIVKWRKFYYALIALLLPILPWLIIKVVYKLSFSNTEGGLGWHPIIFQKLAETLFLSNNWNIWWPVFTITSVLVIKKVIQQKILLPAWIMFAIVCATIVAINLFTEHYLWAVDHTALSRLLIPLVPMSMLLIMSSIKSEPIKEYD